MPKGHLKEIRDGAVVIESEAKVPWGVDYKNAKKPFVVTHEVRFKIGMVDQIVPVGYRWDGASVPRLLWLILGFRSTDRSLPASLIHDYFCDNPHLCPRVVADAVFLSVLKASGVGAVRRYLMWRGVRSWSLYRAISAWLFKGNDRRRRR